MNVIVVGRDIDQRGNRSIIYNVERQFKNSKGEDKTGYTQEKMILSKQVCSVLYPQNK